MKTYLRRQILDGVGEINTEDLRLSNAEGEEKKTAKVPVAELRRWLIDTVVLSNRAPGARDL